MTEIVSERTFHILSDTHITGDPLDIRDVQVQKLADDLDANSIPTPLARLHPGDLVDLGTPAEDAVAVAFMDALGGDWYVAGGNHDVYSNVRTFEEWATSLGYPSPTYVVDHGDIRTMHVTPSGVDQVGPLSSTTLAWMHAQLQASSDVPHMVVCHRPLYNTADPTGTHSFNSTTSGPTRYQSPDLDIREVLAANGNVVAWISGHIHPKIDAPLLWKAETVGNRRMLHIVAPSTWQAGPPSGSLHDQVYSYFLKYGVEGGFDSLIVRDHVTQTEAAAVLPETDWIVEPVPDPSTAAGPASIAADTNLLVDWAAGTYTFEADILGWTLVVGATLSQDTVIARGGSASLKVVTPGAAVNEGTRTASTIFVDPSRKYGAKVWVRAPVGATMEMLLWERTAANGNIGSTPANFVGTGDWQLVTVERTFGATGGMAWIVVRTRTAAQAITFHVDDVGLGSENAGVYTTALANLLPAAGITADIESDAVLVAYDFEADIDGWGGAGGATVSRDTVSPITGVGSLKVDTPGNALYEGVRIVSPFITATPGTGYRFTAIVDFESGADMRVRLAEYDSGNAFIGATSVNFTGVGGPQLISATRKLEIGSKVGVRIETRTSAQSTTFRVDGVSIGTALAGWAPTTADAVISRDTVTPLAGTASLKVVTAGVATDEGVRVPNHFSVTPDRTHQLTFVAKAPAASTLNVTLAEYDSDDVSIDSTTVSFNGTGAAQNVLVAHEFSEDGVRAGIRIDTRVSAQAITFHLDSLTFGRPKMLVAPSRTYRASAWVHAPSTASLRLVIGERKADDVIVGETAFAFSGTSAWKYVEVDKTFGADGERARVWVDTGTSALPVAFNVDDIRLSTATGHPPALRNVVYDYGLTGATEYAYRVRALTEISEDNYDPLEWEAVVGELEEWLKPIILATRERPPDDLVCYVENPDGSELRLGGDEPDAALADCEVGTTLPGGFSTADAEVALRGINPPTVRKFASTEIRLPDRTVVWDGRVESTPERSAEGRLDLSLIGHQALLLDEARIQFLGVDNDLTAWDEPPRERRQAEAEDDRSVNGAFSVDVSEGGITITMDPDRNVDASAAGEVWYLHTAPERIAEVQYVASDTQAADMTSSLRVCNALTGTALDTLTDLTTDLTVDSWVPSVTGKRAYFRDSPDNNDTPKTARILNLHAASVYGDHGLPQVSIEGLPAGLLFSDVLRYLIGLYGGGLRTEVNGVDTIEDSSFPSPRLAWFELMALGDILEEGIALEADRDWAVWNDKVLHYGQRMSMGRLWTFRRSEGASYVPAGSTSEPDYNGVIVAYADKDGTQRWAGPPGSGADTEDAALADTDPGNPVNASSALGNRYLTVDLDTADSEKAIRVGEIALAEALRSRFSGEVRLPRYAEREGEVLPTSLLRAGDRVLDGDIVGGEEMLLVETSYRRSDGAQPMSATVDLPANRLDSAIARMGAKPRKVNRRRIRRRARQAHRKALRQRAHRQAVGHRRRHKARRTRRRERQTNG